jgi:hypothetical protein
VVGAHQYRTGNSGLVESVHDIVIPQHSWIPRIGSKVHASRLILETWRETSTSSEAHQHWQWQEGPVDLIGPNLLVCIVWRPLQLLRGVICGEGFPGSWGVLGRSEGSGGMLKTAFRSPTVRTNSTILGNAGSQRPIPPPSQRGRLQQRRSKRRTGGLPEGGLGPRMEAKPRMHPRKPSITKTDPTPQTLDGSSPTVA